MMIPERMKSASRRVIVTIYGVYSIQPRTILQIKLVEVGFYAP